jgi:hypothetical protein
MGYAATQIKCRKKYLGGFFMYGYGGYGYSSGPSIMDFIGPIIGIIVAIIVLNIVIRIVKSKGKNGISGGMDAGTGFLSMRGRTGVQKKVIKYFNSTGILGAIFKISNSTFDSILNSRVSKYGAQIENRALTAHGMDADEAKEIPPIRVENYFTGSRFFKMFRDHTFRASEYQMSYLMFSDKQLYAYSHIFDLTSDNATEQTREYFYEDITSVDVVQKDIEFPDPRPMGYLISGIASLFFAFIMFAVVGGGDGMFFALCGVVAGILLLAILGYSRSVVKSLILRITVAGDEFICAMKPENLPAIQGMKAKIREKKR